MLRAWARAPRLCCVAAWGLWGRQNQPFRKVVVRHRVSPAACTCFEVPAPSPGASRALSSRSSWSVVCSVGVEPGSGPVLAVGHFCPAWLSPSSRTTGRTGTGRGGSWPASGWEDGQPRASVLIHLLALQLRGGGSGRPAVVQGQPGRRSPEGRVDAVCPARQSGPARARGLGELFVSYRMPLLLPLCP